MRLGAAVTLCAGLCSAASADALQEGAAAFAQNDAATALRLLQPLAEAGDPVAGCMVTILRDRAQGRVAYDADAMATTCIDAAAGKAPAELDLAGNYRSGLIVEHNVAKAVALYRRAADQGLPVAQKVLGDLYAQGIGVPRDFATACGWWGRAAMQARNSEAQRNYGTCYLTGTGVARSETQALAWWLIAKSNESDDKNGLPSWVFQSEAEADRSADALMRRLPAAQVEAAQALARAWRPKPE
jgi:TPR repeat protein